MGATLLPRRSRQWGPQIVTPASPRTIVLLSEEGSRPLAALGPVRLVRQMLVAVIVLLLVFVALAATSYVSTESGDIFTSTGLDVLANELFFLAAGGIGAAFWRPLCARDA